MDFSRVSGFGSGKGVERHPTTEHALTQGKTVTIHARSGGKQSCSSSGRSFNQAILAGKKAA
jgi:hypothetical protein